MKMLSIISVSFVFTMTSISLFFVVYTMIELRNKYDEKRTPYRLSDTNRQYLEDIKVRLAVLFPLSFLLLLGVFLFGNDCVVDDVNVKCLLNTELPLFFRSV
jgi:Trk-type K+ transport system membrane component